ncbi:MAG: DUF2277 domain-containing protein [Dehalococcoidia bacterium]|nr:DUF2277 domain-containing protein [Dehalococcoidia bacterium]
MCRSIKRLRAARGSEDAPPTPEEIEAAALQFVRKVSGFQKPAAHNAAVFDAAVADISATTERLLASLQVR